MTTEAVTTQLATDFPDLHRVLNVFPELRRLFDQAEAGGWSSLQFQQQLWQTNWWTNRSESARLWDTEAEKDPGTAQRRREQLSASLEARARMWGITVEADELADLVEMALRWDFTEQEVNNALAGYGDPAQIDGGDVGSDAAQIKSRARAYLLHMTDDEADRLALQIAQGHASLDGINASLRNQAKRSFPQFADDIDSGVTIYDATANIRNQVATVLELSPDDVDFMDDKWLDLIDYDDGTGADRRMMTRAEAGRWARSQHEYRFTEGAAAKAASIGTALLEGLGIARF